MREIREIEKQTDKQKDRQRNEVAVPIVLTDALNPCFSNLQRH